MKEEINLLPPEIIKRRVNNFYLKRISRIGWFAVISLVIVFVSSLSINIVLRESLVSVASKVEDLDNEESVVLKEEIESVNEFMRSFWLNSREYEAWTPLIKDIVDIMPANVSIFSLALEKRGDEQVLTLRALSSQRSEVVAWQRSLEELAWVRQIEAPLQNFATGVDTPFSFTLYREEKSI